jgi:hypothetical protein
MAEDPSRPFIQVGDFTGLKEPLVKLIDTLGAGAGRASDGIANIANAYWLASKNAQNEAERLRLVEGARTQVLTERAKAFAALSTNSYQQLKDLSITANEVSAHLADLPAELLDIQARSNYRVACQNIIHQLNLEAVEEVAAGVLAHESMVTSEPVSLDWMARLRDIVQNVSSEELHILWGNILAGEIKQPGCYSLRTLEVLRNLTQQEAQLFRLAANFTIKIEQDCMIGIARYGHYEMVSSEYGFSYNELQKLIDCGLISPTNQNIHLSPKDFDQSSAEKSKYAWQNSFQIGNQVLIINAGEAATSTHYNVHFFTKAGNELYKLVSNEAQLPLPFLAAFTRPIRQEGMRTYYAKLTGQLPDGTFTHEQPLIEIPNY